MLRSKIKLGTPTSSASKQHLGSRHPSIPQLNLKYSQHSTNQSKERRNSNSNRRPQTPTSSAGPRSVNKSSTQKMAVKYSKASPSATMEQQSLKRLMVVPQQKSSSKNRLQVQRKSSLVSASPVSSSVQLLTGTLSQPDFGHLIEKKSEQMRQTSHENINPIEAFVKANSNRYQQTFYEE